MGWHLMPGIEIENVPQRELSNPAKKLSETLPKKWLELLQLCVAFVQLLQIGQANGKWELVSLGCSSNFLQTNK